MPFGRVPLQFNSLTWSSFTQDHAFTSRISATLEPTGSSGAASQNALQSAGHVDASHLMASGKQGGLLFIQCMARFQFCRAISAAGIC